MSNVEICSILLIAAICLLGIAVWVNKRAWDKIANLREQNTNLCRQNRKYLFELKARDKKEEDDATIPT